MKIFEINALRIKDAYAASVKYNCRIRLWGDEPNHVNSFPGSLIAISAQNGLHFLPQDGFCSAGMQKPVCSEFLLPGNLGSIELTPNPRTLCLVEVKDFRVYRRTKSIDPGDEVAFRPPLPAGAPESRAARAAGSFPQFSGNHTGAGRTRSGPFGYHRSGKRPWDFCPWAGRHCRS